MNEKPFFVMLYNKHHIITPLLRGDNIAMFESVHDAMEAGYNSPLGEAYGFDVFETGNRVDGADGI